ncbi:MAG: FAD-dependent oxidoreductase [Planctomycetota bacterium]|jgi:hypothetical protein|nr:FAD-dependent oxidoreductase [Planctomycetota bacterium]
MSHTSIPITRTLPVRDQVDLVVVGAGMGGIGAACAAARAGLRVVLVERAALLGGNATLGGVGNWCYCGPLAGQGAVFADVLALQRQLGSIDPEHGWPMRINQELGRENHLFDTHVLPLVLQHLCERDGVTLCLHTDLVDVVRDGRRITAVVIHDRSGLAALRCRAVVDASGDGLVAQRAGCGVLDVADRSHPDLLAPSLMVYLRRVAAGAPQQLLADAATTDPRPCPRYSVWPEPHDRIGLKTKWEEWHFDCGSGPGLTQAETTTRRLVPAVVRAYQQQHGDNWILDHVAPILGLREGRRIRGEHVLTVDEVRAGARFEDAVAFGAFTIDSAAVNERVPPYQIPLRSLIASGLDNLLLAGRCISADRLAMASARVMATCCMEGTAAGIAVAQSLAAGLEPCAADPAAIRAALIAAAPVGDHELMQERLATGVMP